MDTPTQPKDQKHRSRKRIHEHLASETTRLRVSTRTSQVPHHQRSFAISERQLAMISLTVFVDRLGRLENQKSVPNKIKGDTKDTYIVRVLHT